MSPGSRPGGFNSGTTLGYSSRGGKAGNGGINSKWGGHITLHFLSSDSHRMKHLSTTKPSSEFSYDSQNKWPKYLCWSQLKLSNRCSSTDSNCSFHTLVKPTVRRSISSNFLLFSHNYRQSKLENKRLARRPGPRVLWRQRAQGQRTCQNTIETMTSTKGM